ncbi:hypothetical protein CJ010_24520 [Azoarcus sp. DD4]|uniref:M35 family metallo-endopeptidase n=1 Tax=Azoarcus sp. DD4 TaxID=2027405 RepID=UPI001128F3F8|nr:M35 family metallo-endopeptidase [Azoarcus sp. DD4]QDF99476.1 hypothetical protein CJ010_24520 [Azoarcus sp. DD4]
MGKFTEIYTKAKDVLANQDFDKDWQAFLNSECKVKALFGADGFDVARAQDPERVRKRLRELSKWNKRIGAVIVEAATNPASAGTLAERAAALKMVRHVYRISKKGAQSVWVYSPPKAYTKGIFDEIAGDAKAVEAKLNNERKIFSSTEMQWMASALAVALKISEDAKAKLSGTTGKAADTDAMVKRWFLDEDSGDAELASARAKLLAGFQKIAVACASDKLVFTDYVDWIKTRNKYFGAAFRGGEGGGFPVIYLEGAFTRLTGNTGKMWLCAETIIHEFSHHEVSTRDHRYDSSGLKPSKTTLPYAKAIENADSWGYFALDLAGYLSTSDRSKVLK